MLQFFLFCPHLWSCFCMNQSCAVSRSRSLLLVRCLLCYPAEHGVSLPFLLCLTLALCAFFRQILGDVITMSEEARDVGIINTADLLGFFTSCTVCCLPCHVASWKQLCLPVYCTVLAFCSWVSRLFLSWHVGVFRNWTTKSILILFCFHDRILCGHQF